MRGLLIKDLRLLKNQGKILFVIIVVMGVLVLISDSNPSFLAAYITIFLAIFTISTISYDEYDNGYLFVLTLPVSRKGYVREKYVFGLLSAVIAWCIGMSAGTAVLLRMSSHGSLKDWFLSGVLYIAVAVIFLGFMIPLRLKFEAEKARYANLTAIIVMLILYTVGRGCMQYLPASWKANIAAFFAGLGDMGIWLCVMVTALVVLIISYLCSSHIISQKEF